VGPVVTVAELMRRCSPASGPTDDEGADPIPVAALLRREGRSATGLPVVQAPGAGDLLSTLPPRHPVLRRGKIAAGALLAAGSVFGLTAAMNAPSTPPNSSGVYPDQGEPTAGSPSGGVLDAGHAAPTSWLPVAFPTAYPETVAQQPAAARPARQAGAPTAAAAPARRVATNAAAQARSTSTAAGSSAPAGNGSSGGLVEQTTKTVGNTVGNVGSTVEDVGSTVSDLGKDTPLHGVTETVGDTVGGLGRTVDEVAAPVTAPVKDLGRTVDKVTAPVTTPVTSLLTDTVKSTSSSKAPKVDGAAIVRSATSILG
jgi:hypothetical protein